MFEHSSTCLSIWIRSRNCSCLVTWFGYQLIAKPGNKTAIVPWPNPYILIKTGWCELSKLARYYPTSLGHIVIKYIIWNKFGSRTLVWSCYFSKILLRIYSTDEPKTIPGKPRLVSADALVANLDISGSPIENQWDCIVLWRNLALYNRTGLEYNNVVHLSP